MHQKYIPNVSPIQPSLPTSQSFKYCKYQIKHTQFIIIIYIYSKFIPKFNLLSLYLSHSSTVKIQKIPNFPNCIRNASQIYPKFNLLSLHVNHSNIVNIKSSMYTVHHNYLYLFQIYPKIQPSLPISQSLKYCKNPKNPKCIRNASQIYPKFNLLSLHLSHSNTVNIKSSIHSSS